MWPESGAMPRSPMRTFRPGRFCIEASGRQTSPRSNRQPITDRIRAAGRAGDSPQHQATRTFASSDARETISRGPTIAALNPNDDDGGNTRHHRNTRRQAPRRSRSAARRHRQSVKGFSS